MITLNTHIENYLSFCKSQKCLDAKTIKAYRIDLLQFVSFVNVPTITDITCIILEQFISFLHEKYKPKTAKRKIATIKAFYSYLEYKAFITSNPFSRLHIKFREPIILPKTIPLQSVEALLHTLYDCYNTAKTPYRQNKLLQNIAIIELLFSTGIRISELCNLKYQDINLDSCTMIIYGKGAKERKIQIGNESVIHILKEYTTQFNSYIQKNRLLFHKYIWNPCIRPISKKND